MGTIRYRKDRRRTLAALTRDDSGAAAVEFAFIAFPFLALLFAVLQTSLVIFSGQLLQTMVSDVSRKIMTGQLAGGSKEDFRAALCASRLSIFNCDKFLLQVQSFPDFASANPTEFVNPDCFDTEKAADASCYNPGGAEEVVVVRVSYPWPFGIGFENLAKPHELVGLAAFRSEPY